MASSPLTPRIDEALELASRFLSEGEVFGALREFAKADFWIEQNSNLNLRRGLIRPIDLSQADANELRRATGKRIVRARSLLSTSGALVEEERFLILTIAMEIALVLRYRGHFADAETLSENELLRRELTEVFLDPINRPHMISIAHAISRNSGIDLGKLLDLPK